MGHVIGISKTLCKCGCGGFTSAWSTGNDSEWINGHQSRMAGEANKQRLLNGGTNSYKNDNIFDGIKEKSIRELLYFKFDSRCYLCKCDDQILHKHHNS